MTTWGYPFDPYPKQQQALRSTADELLFGGSLGGGKSELLLAACVDLCTLVPNAKALLVRRTFPELQELRKRLRDRIPGDVARENKADNIFTFYNGAQLILRYLDNEEDATRLQGFEIQLACFDELTHYDESSYALVLSRLRATGQVKADMDRYGFRLRALSASNPGGKGHSWVKERFIEPAPAGEPFTGEDGTVRQFIPSSLYDNPYIDHEDYVRRLGALDPERKRALIEGDWGIPSGVRFPQFREKVHTVAPEELPIDVIGHARVVGVDFGFSDPFAAVWMAKVHGVVVVYREELSQELTATQQAQRILELEAEGERRPERPITVALDPAAWRRDVNHVGPKLGGEDAPLGSIAHSYKQILGGKGGQVVKGMNDRLHGWAMLDELLAVDDRTGLPGILIYNNCRQLIKALSSAPRDKRRPEDVDTHWAQDHLLDGLRYGYLELLGRNYHRKSSGHERLSREGRSDTVMGDVSRVGF